MSDENVPQEECEHASGVCHHTPEQHEIIERVTFYTDPDKTTRGDPETDAELIAKLREQFPEGDLCGELMVAGRHMFDYHPVVNPEVFTDHTMEGMQWITQRAHGHAHAFMESVMEGDFADKGPMDLLALATAFGTAVLIDGVMLGAHANGNCIAPHQHDRFGEVSEQAEAFLAHGATEWKNGQEEKSDD